MAQNTHISWTDHTFNPWTGCTKVSPGCANCYAEGWAKRSGIVEWGKGKDRRRTSPTNWKDPIRWNKSVEIAQAETEFPQRRPRVFCASLADWLDDEAPIEWLADLLELIHATPNLDWLLLTKRPQNFTSRMVEISALPGRLASMLAMQWSGWGNTPPNVWIGTTVEDQQRADERIPVLLDIPAKVRFLSCEPLLEAVDIRGTAGIHWVIVGGESGPGFRPFNPDWARSLRDQCAGAAFHMKQMGGLRPTTMPPIPSDLMIREYPTP